MGESQSTEYMKIVSVVSRFQVGDTLTYPVIAKCLGIPDRFGIGYRSRVYRAISQANVMLMKERGVFLRNHRCVGYILSYANIMDITSTVHTEMRSITAGVDLPPAVRSAMDQITSGFVQLGQELAHSFQTVANFTQEMLDHKSIPPPS
jgi:hypothetical protein